MLAACGAVLLAPLVASARGPTRAELEAEGLSDPRARTMPARHRLRIGLLADWVRASQACTPNGQRCQRFHFAPLMLDIGYQAQLVGWFFVRPSISFGGNVANSRNAMPFVLQQNIHVGYQGKLLGLGAGYSFLFPFPVVANQDDGHLGLAQPALWGNHAVQAEVSLTSRKFGNGALFFALRVGGMKTHLIHLDLDRHRWFAITSFNAGWLFDLGAARKRRRTAP